MGEAWKELRARNDREDEIRSSHERYAARYMLHITPALPAIVWLTYSESSLVDVVGSVAFLIPIRDVFGSGMVAYGLVFVYFALIGLFRLAFYRLQSFAFSMVVTWLSWAWFYLCLWKLESLEQAFAGLFVLSLLAVKTLGFLTFCYEKIRDGMFLQPGSRG